MQTRAASGFVGLAAIGVVARLEVNPRAEGVIVVHGKIERDIELVDETADIDRNGKELMDVNARDAQAAKIVDQIGEVAGRVVGLVRLAGHAQGDKAVGSAVQNVVFCRADQVVSDLLDVLFGAATPMVGDVQKGRLRAETCFPQRAGCW